MPAQLPKIPPRARRDPLTRSQIMSRIQSMNTRPEVLTCAAVHRMGFRFRKHVADLPGKPDMANKRRKWAIFVHGCFWHSHDNCSLASSPKTNTDYWIVKLRRNRERDEIKLRELRAKGFRVLVVWECETRDGHQMHERLRGFFEVLET